MSLADLPLVVLCVNGMDYHISTLPFFRTALSEILRLHRIYVSRYDSIVIFPSFYRSLLPIVIAKLFNSRQAQVLVYGFFSQPPGSSGEVLGVVSAQPTHQ